MSMTERMQARGNLAKAILEAFPEMAPDARMNLGAAIEDLIDAKLNELPVSMPFVRSGQSL